MEFLGLFFRCHFAGKLVVTSQNVGCFLRLFRRVLPEFDSHLELRIFLCLRVIKFSFFFNYETIKKTTQVFNDYVYLPTKILIFFPLESIKHFI